MMPRPVLDIKKPMRVVNMDKPDRVMYTVSNVLFFNDDCIFCEIQWKPRPDEPSKYHYIQFAMPSGVGLVPSKFPLVLENYEPEPAPPLPLLERVREFARSAHLRVGQMYDDKPYIYHVDMAADVAREYKHLVPEEDFETFLAGVYMHDVPEDVHFVTYNNLLKLFDAPIANIAYALQNEKGKNRKERANDKYYEGIRNTKGAPFGKCCDRLANIRHGVAQGGHMVDGYRSEHPHFKKQLFTEELRPMFSEMEILLGL